MYIPAVCTYNHPLRLSVCICMYAYAYVCVYIYIYIYIYGMSKGRLYICIYICTYIHIHTQASDTEGSYVAVWNLQRAFVKSDKPDEIFDTPSSVMALSFHPRHPAILAAG
jgi:hypothetical protein